MDFYNKYTPKELNEKFGIIAVHFEPYDDLSYLWDTDSIKSLTQSIKEYAYSTIYQDFRYFFKSGEDLKKFINMTAQTMKEKERYYVDGLDVTDCKYFKEFYCRDLWRRKEICKANKNCDFKKNLTAQNDR